MSDAPGALGAAAPSLAVKTHPFFQIPKKQLSPQQKAAKAARAELNKAAAAKAQAKAKVAAKPAAAALAATSPKAAARATAATSPRTAAVTAPKKKKTTKKKPAAKKKAAAKKAAVKAPRKRRDPNKPKAAKSAYLHFCSAKRGDIKATHPEFTQKDLLQEIGARWKAMTDRATYVALAAADAARYAEAMRSYVPPKEDPAAAAAAAKEAKKKVAAAKRAAKAATKKRAPSSAKKTPPGKKQKKAAACGPGFPTEAAAAAATAPSAAPKAAPKAITTPKKKTPPMSPKKRAKLMRAKQRSAKKKKDTKIKATRKFIREFDFAMRKRKRGRDAETKKHEAALKSLEDAEQSRFPIEDAELCDEPALVPPLPTRPAPMGRIAWPEHFEPDRWGTSFFIYRYISRESCSQFDSLPLTSLTIHQRLSTAFSRALAARRRPTMPAPAALQTWCTCGTSCARSRCRSSSRRSHSARCGRRCFTSAPTRSTW